MEQKVTHQALKAFAATAGSASPKIVLLGEAWGESESNTRQPFVGLAGKELWSMLGEAMPLVEQELHAKATVLHKYGNAWIGERAEWLAAAGIGMTNVFALRPMDNKIEHLCVDKLGPHVPGLPALARSKYLDVEYADELARLEEELLSWQPNLVVCLGNTACWALLRATNIGSIRGAITTGSLGRWNGKVLPTYHPAGVLRQWSWRPIVVADLMKAAREGQHAEIIRPSRRVLIEPTIHELLDWTEKILSTPPEMLANDIETRGGQISCIGFAPSASEACCIPFIDFGQADWSYWRSASDEKLAWGCVQRLLESNIVKIYQNGLYDLQYIMKMGIRPGNCTEDTMLLHHSLYPEMQKGLGFLGSMYSNESSWKLMHKMTADTVKRDE